MQPVAKAEEAVLLQAWEPVVVQLVREQQVVGQPVGALLWAWEQGPVLPVVGILPAAGAHR